MITLSGFKGINNTANINQYGGITLISGEK